MDSMKRLSVIAIAIIVMVAVAATAALLWTPNGVQADGGERSWEEEDAELTRAEAYVSQSNAGGHVTFVLNDGPARAPPEYRMKPWRCSRKYLRSKTRC